MENKDETKALAFVPVRNQRYIDSKLELREPLPAVNTVKKEKLPR